MAVSTLILGVKDMACRRSVRVLVVGCTYVVLGVGMAANAIVCGPDAFEFKRWAVAAMVIGGFAVCGVGLWFLNTGKLR